MRMLSFLGVIYCLLSGNCYACECDSAPSINQSISENFLILSGKIVSKKIVNIERLSNITRLLTRKHKIINPQFGAKYYEYVVEVSELYKGKIKKTLKIYSEYLNSACGIELESGLDYLIYVDEIEFRSVIKRERDKIYKISSCGRTRLYSADEIKILKYHLKSLRL